MTNASGTPYLVIGATGQHGSTGRYVAERLMADGKSVRALVRRDDERAAHLRALGAETIVGDLHDRSSLLPALQDVATAFFVYPVASGIVEAAANFASAARHSGLQRVVVMSMAASNPESPSPLGKAQWLAEEVLEWAGLACLHLRILAFFYENIELLHARSIRDANVIRNSFGDVAVNWISGEDAALLAYSALVSPEKFGTQTTVYPSGGERLSFARIAEMLSEKLGRQIRYETVSQSIWEGELVELADTIPQINPGMAKHISSLGAAIKEAFPSNNMFESVVGRRPQTLADLLAAGSLGIA